MQYEHHSDIEDLRDLPVQGRVNALRDQITRRFGAKAVGFRPRQEPRKSQPHASQKRITRASSFLVLGIAVALSLFRPAPAHAGTLDLDLNLASVHTEAWARDSLNQRNPGVGVAYHWSRTWAVAGGIYTNSYRKPTLYALAEFTPFHLGQVDHWHVDAGAAAGLASGYTRLEIPCEPVVGVALIRVTAPDEVSLSVVGVPNMGRGRSGFIGFQMSAPLGRSGGAE